MSNAFYDSVAQVLEVDEVGFDTEFRKAPGWCSLQAFGLLVLMENDWKAPMDLARLRGMRTVGDLYGEAFAAFAASLLGVPRAALSPDAAYGSVPEWDSVNHLRLVMEAEKRFGVHYPLETIPGLRTLRDFLV
ncbi:MAG: acyl carrier protein [Kiritimatiellae bacterium]|nr:acyl carrier protein [Kiritimatiellia bacterium]